MKVISVKKNKKKILALFLAFIVLITAFVSVYKSKRIKNTLFASSNVKMQRTVIIDAGHGGFDGGAVASDGTSEKNINLSVSKKTRDLLRLFGYNVIMTRTDDTGTEDDSNESISNRKKSDLKNRLLVMENNPDAIFVSIHLNKFQTRIPFGTQVFYSANDDKSKILGESLQNEFVRLINPENKRVAKKENRNTYLLKNAVVPAVIVECGFLSNNEELALLKSDEYQSKLALSILCGIEEYYKK